MSINSSNLSWKDHKLYYGTKDTGISVFQWPDENYVHWKYKLADGSISEDFYNITRAKDNAAKMYQEHHYEKPLEGR